MDDVIKEQIAALYDATQILDILGLDTLDLVNALEDRIIEDFYLFTEINWSEYV